MTTAWRAPVLLLLAVVPCPAQEPILEVRLENVGQTLVRARLTPNGMIELPAAPLEELTGEDLGDAEYLSLPSLSELLGPQVEVEYDPRRALLLIRDLLGGLAATRALHARRQAVAQTRPRNFSGAGPFGSLTAELDGGRLIEGGWSFGRVAAAAGHSTESGARWGVSGRFLSQTYVTYDDGERRDPRLGLRWAGGRTFVNGSYVPAEGDLHLQAATSLGPWTAVFQEDGSAALSYRAGVQITLARTPDQYVTRISFGRNPSPFSFPRVR